MAELRALCDDLRWTEVATYIQSGNVVFGAEGDPAALETVLEEALAARFGFAVPVMIRTSAQWAAYPRANPFPKAAADEPNRLMLLLSKAPPAAGAEDAIQARAMHGERVGRAGDAIWIHYPNGQADTKLTPSFIDRAIGSPATARNFRTVATLAEMLKT